MNVLSLLFDMWCAVDFQDLFPSTIAVGPSADTNTFNELDFPHV